MVSRWRRRRQQRRTLRSHRAPRGWRPPPPPVETDEPDEPIEISGPDEDSGELTVRGYDAAHATVRLAIGSRAAEEIADEGWLAEPDPEEHPPAGSRPRSRRFGRTAAWVLGLIVVAAVAVVVAAHLV